MNDRIARPLVTPVEDISYLLTNVTSSLYIKLESMQRLKTHKYRLVYGLVKNLLQTHKMKDFTGFVEASDGNAGLALAEISNQINKELILFLPSRVDVHLKNKILKYGNVTIKECYDIEDALNHGKDFANRYPGYMYLDQYNNASSVEQYENMALEVLDVLPQVDTLIMNIDTGAGITGMSNILNSYTIGVTVDNNYTSLPEMINFRLLRPQQIITSANQKGLINHWEKLTVDEIVEFHTQLNLLIPNLPVVLNYATAANILAAIKFGNLNNGQTILTVDVGR